MVKPSATPDSDNQSDSELSWYLPQVSDAHTLESDVTSLRSTSLYKGLTAINGSGRPKSTAQTYWAVSSAKRWRRPGGLTRNDLIQLVGTRRVRFLQLHLHLHAEPLPSTGLSTTRARAYPCCCSGELCCQPS